MLPQQFIEKIEKLVVGHKASSLAESYFYLSDNYKQASSPVVQYKDALAYACARMPATFATIERVMHEFYKKCPDYAFTNVLDIGSGTGALMCYFSQLDITYHAVERSESMIKLSQQIIENCELKPKIYKDCVERYLNCEQQYACSFFVYSLNEIANKTEVLQKVIDHTEDYVFIIEAGTPKGFEIVQLAKRLASKNNCGIIAPCASHQCPLEKSDWCHFNVRLPRTKIHNLVKQSKLAYEDEKFCYIILSKKVNDCVSNNRVIKRPMKKTGHVIFDVCTRNGTKRLISKDKLNRKKEWGDEVEE